MSQPLFELVTPARAEFEIKRSRFIGDLIPVANPEAAKAELARIRSLHPQARHHCSAWIAGLPDQSHALAASDDGEPAGTAGRPMLAILQGNQLCHVLAVVTRYSGGIKLGTGGLVKAYGDAVKLALAEAELKPFHVKHAFSLHVPYRLWDAVNYQCSTLQVEWIKQEYTADVIAHGLVKHKDFSQLQQLLSQFMPHVQIFNEKD